MGLTKQHFNDLLDKQGTLIIDGALATELENRGHDLSHALWSGKTLREDPNAIKQVHLDYFLAGADIAITASYQATTQGLQEHFQLAEEEAKDLIKLSATLAQDARSEAYKQGVPRSRTLLVAGSVGPYGAYLANGSEYRGDYKLSAEEYHAFHRPRVQALVDAGVDFLAIETIPSFDELKALEQLLEEEFPRTLAWLCCTLKDADHICDGTPIAEAFRYCNDMSGQIVAFGVNCVPPELVEGSLKSMTAATTDMPKLPLLCYPNSGEVYVAKDHAWTGDKSGQKMRDNVAAWSNAGAKLIGGCCRTTPDDIRNISLVLRREL